MPQGKIVKTASTLYTVRETAGVLETAGGCEAEKLHSGENVWLCRPRGRFRRDGIAPLAGDEVLFEPHRDGNGVLTEILPRRNSLVRPPVANIDRLIIVVSAAPPVTARLMIDSMTALAAFKGIEPVICINKTDLAPGAELAELYASLGYATVSVSAADGSGLDALAARLRGAFCVLTGNSGVGKSSLINRLYPGFEARTGGLSEMIGRDRQTTRHVELLATEDGGYVADTPGYSCFDAVEMEMTDAGRLPFCFPEFAGYLGGCRYSDCSHVRDDGCAVLAAVAEGKIAVSRHESYVRLYERVKDLKQWEM